MTHQLFAIIALLSPVSAFAGWTNLPLRPGAKIVYVSSSEGSDLNDGLTPATAKRTLTGTPAPTPNRPNNRIAGGFAVLTSGTGDHLYLRRGDTFSEPDLLAWNKSGFSLPNTRRCSAPTEWALVPSSTAARNWE